jgi:acetolactate synthase-1/2/3 large subunit
MLILSPSMPSDVEGRDTGFLHESKHQGAAMGGLITSRTAHTAEEALTAIDDAFSLRRPRPVHLQLPLDLLKGTVPLSSGTPPAGGSRREAEPKGTVPLGSAVVLGGGARGAGEAALALGLPVVTTVNGKGVVDERHPLSLGASLRLRCVQEWLGTRDTVVAVGTELGESDLWGPVPALKRVIRVDIDPGQIDKNVVAAEGIVGDAREVLERMRGAAAGDEDLRPLKAAIREEALGDGARWVPLMEVLDEVLGEHGILAGDSTQAAYYGAVHFLPMDARRRFIYPTGYATLGYALPAAIGAKLAAPDRAVIALIGDGGLMFTVAELATAAQLRLPLPVLVPNNRGYGEIRDQMLDAGIEPVGVDLDPPDLPKLAEALGGTGIRAQAPAAIKAALEAALERAGPTVIEIPG